jgi:hypothetical protein
MFLHSCSCINQTPASWFMHVLFLRVRDKSNECPFQEVSKGLHFSETTTGEAILIQILLGVDSLCVSDFMAY